MKSALYDDRLVIPEHPVLKRELVGLERIPEKSKVDHPKNGSKDVSDGLAGVVYGLSMRREIWSDHGVLGVIPPSMLRVGASANVF